jgi:exoribonuclease R
VHIADVCGFVPADSALDIEAKERGTTVYLPHERHDMLPSLISSDLASLHGQVDRFTVSVTWDVAVTHKDGSLVEEAEDLMTLDAKGDVYFSMPALPSWAGRGVIHSIAAATYAQAHNLIHGLPSDPKEELVPPGQAGRAIKKSKCARLRSDLRSLTAFARWLQRNRESLGALDLSQGSGAELKFKTDAEGNPVEVSGKEEMEVHHTISELMIAANSGVATIIYQAQPSQTLLRIHPPPSAEKLKMLQAEVLDAGIDLFQQKPSSDMQALLRTYREKVSRGHQPMAAELLTASVIRAMNEARYVGSGSLTGELAVAGPSSGSAADGRYLGHFGLGLRLYTHFTSPIRRYADVIVHRQLLSVLEAQSSAPKVGVVESVTVAEVADDLDFLDDLLDGVGDELFPQGIAIAGGGDNSNVKDIVKTPSEGKQKEPYSAAELEVVSTHLNTMNRRSKACQLGCQKLFLCMYFAGRTETHEGLISALKDNGFM